jgi:hypothetical protein
LRLVVHDQKLGKKNNGTKTKSPQTSFLKKVKFNKLRQSRTAFGLLKAPELQRLSGTVEVLRVGVMIVGVISVGVMTVGVMTVGVISVGVMTCCFFRKTTHSHWLSAIPVK